MPNETEIEQKEKGFIAHVFFWVAVGFAVAAIYVLSVGPVIKYACVPGVRAPVGIRAFYAPLIWLHEKSRPAGKFLDWYTKRVWHAE